MADVAVNPDYDAPSNIDHSLIGPAYNSDIAKNIRARTVQDKKVEPNYPPHPENHYK